MGRVEFLCAWAVLFSLWRCVALWLSEVRLSILAQRGSMQQNSHFASCSDWRASQDANRPALQKLPPRGLSSCSTAWKPGTNSGWLGPGHARRLEGQATSAFRCGDCKRRQLIATTVMHTGRRHCPSAACPGPSQTPSCHLAPVRSRMREAPRNHGMNCTPRRNGASPLVQALAPVELGPSEVAAREVSRSAPRWPRSKAHRKRVVATCTAQA